MKQLQNAPHTTVLYDYWRSSASYRVRIALHLANIPFESVIVDLLTGEQSASAHLARHPQGLVPVLDIDGHRFTQSLGIIEYLDTTRQLGLWPDDPATRARVNGAVGCIAIDTHPVCNLSVAKFARGDDMSDRADWMQHFISKGLNALETLLSAFPPNIYAAGNYPGIVEICLIPQLYNARRWDVNYGQFARIRAIADTCQTHPAFVGAMPIST